MRENRLRRIAERRGLRLEKSRRRDPDAIDFGGFMLIEAHKNTVVLGANHFAYSASLEDVEQYLAEFRVGDLVRYRGDAPGPVPQNLGKIGRIVDIGQPPPFSGHIWVEFPDDVAKAVPRGLLIKVGPDEKRS